MHILEAALRISGRLDGRYLAVYNPFSTTAKPRARMNAFMSLAISEIVMNETDSASAGSLWPFSYQELLVPHSQCVEPSK